MKKLFYFLAIIIHGIINAQVGIKTDNPKTTLDVNGKLTIRETPPYVDGEFYSIGVDREGLVLRKSNDISSFNTYLGFSPMAQKHKETIPFTLENNYVSKITGVAIGACYGVMVNFEIYFLGKRYLGAKLQAISTTSNTSYSPVSLSAQQSVFGKPLEVLANASGCSSDSGHTLSLNSTTGKIDVSFLDRPTYFKDAGTFVIYSFDKFIQYK